VDVEISLVSEPVGPFDYSESANYEIRIQYAGDRQLNNAGTDFTVYANPVDSEGEPTVRFNGNAGPLIVSLSKTSPVAYVTVSVYPPEIDKTSSQAKQYAAAICVEEVEDGQIGRELIVYPTFEDLKAPGIEMVAPYEGPYQSCAFPGRAAVWNQGKLRRNRPGQSPASNQIKTSNESGNPGIIHRYGLAEWNR
jgi:hypothetical protein